MIQNQEMNTATIPMDVVEAEQIPQENGIPYSEICRLIGSLYLEGHLRIKTMEGNYRAMIGNLQRTIENQSKELMALKRQ